jgi:pimeloyl-ACP methyl ester carboxylesterase
MTTAAEYMDNAQARTIKKSVLVDSINTDYWFYPATTADSRKAENVVLVHGYRGDHHGLEAFAGGLTDYNVYAPDIPGFGSSSPMKAEHTLDNYVIWFEKFLKAVDLKNPIAIGHSFGTLIISGAEAKSSQLKALICINPVAGGVTKGVSRFLLNFVKGYYWFAHILPQGAGLAMLKTPLLVDSMSSYTTKSDDKQLRRWIKGQHKTHFNSFANSQVVWQSYIASIDNTMAPYVPLIKKPILLIAAELDEITPVSAVIEMSKKMNNAKVYEIKNCGHLVHYEAAQETIDVIRDFIAKQSD